MKAIGTIVLWHLLLGNDADQHKIAANLFKVMCLR